jgi:hypothetical protein
VNAPKRIDIREFREAGFLQEVNRQFLHPLGLALEIILEADGTMRLGGVWDYRDDPEGMIFADPPPDPEKARHVQELRESKEEIRLERFGWVVQPPGENPVTELKKKGGRK